MKKLVRFIPIFVLGVSACVSTEPPKPPEVLRTFSSDSFYSRHEPPQCKAMLDSYCNFLYSPDVQGNLEVKRRQDSIKVLQGETRNQFSQVFFRYSQAKLQNQRNLPKDFYSVLQRNGYFDKLRIFLDRTPRTTMTLDQRLASEELDYELGYLWSTAFNETVLSRMNAKYPGFFKLPDAMVPLELQLERRRIHRNLVSDISQAIWRNDRNWHSVEQGFARLQDAYLRMIKRLDVPDELRENWTKRILEVKLVLPGAFPAISNEECSSTTVNAYYYTYLNVLTICAGDFNSEDIIQTLAHEMGHALGVDRSEYLYAINSDFGKRLTAFRKDVCQPKTFTCDEWKLYKEDFANSLSSLNGFKPDVPEFQRCLKRRETFRALGAEDIARFARSMTTDRISELASSDRFLRITKPELPTPNGKTQKNPNFLNPCSYSMWSMGEEPIDDELTTLMYFTAEYKCSDKTGAERMKNAIEVTKDMTAEVLKKVLSIEGEFSARAQLETEGFSSPPFERFADVIGSYAMAEMLKQTPDPTDRQNRFLASSSWQCLAPSLDSRFPEESSVEKGYIFEPHLEGDQRRKELFSQPIREAIACKKDFEFKECSLPLK